MKRGVAPEEAKPELDHNHRRLIGTRVTPHRLAEHERRSAVLEPQNDPNPFLGRGKKALGHEAARRSRASREITECGAAPVSQSEPDHMQQRRGRQTGNREERPCESAQQPSNRMTAHPDVSGFLDTSRARSFLRGISPLRGSSISSKGDGPHLPRAIGAEAPLPPKYPETRTPTTALGGPWPSWSPMVRSKSVNAATLRPQGLRVHRRGIGRASGLLAGRQAQRRMDVLLLRGGQAGTLRRG
jgi:hypothetical protein